MIKYQKKGLVNFADFLGQCIDEYVIILKELKSNAIEDDKICANIEELIDIISPYKSTISSISENLKNMINKGVHEITLADEVTFFNNIANILGTKLSRFT